jgi:hypothetical protein
MGPLTTECPPHQTACFKFLLNQSDPVVVIDIGNIDLRFHADEGRFQHQLLR